MDLMKLINEQQNNIEINIDCIKNGIDTQDVKWRMSPAINFLVIGAGGSGAYFVRDFARYLSNSDLIYSIMVVDGDKVEEKNLVRQNFVKADIGQYKAEVTAKRYSKAYGIPILYKNSYIKTVSDVHKCFSDMTHFVESNCEKRPSDVLNIIIGFTDSVPTRKLLSESILPTNISSLKKFHDEISIDNFYGNLKGYLSEDKHDLLDKDFMVTPVGKYIYIDMGNMDYYGQAVTMFNFSSHYNITHSKHIYEFLPDLLKDDTTEISCAERAIEIPQTIFANVTSANVAINILCGILTYGKITSKLAYFNCLDNSVSNKKYTLDDVIGINSNFQSVYDNVNIYSDGCDTVRPCIAIF